MRRGPGAFGGIADNARAVHSDVNPLLVHSVADGSASQYVPKARAFFVWAERYRPDTAEHNLDTYLAEYFAECCYVHRSGVQRGEKTLAAIVWLYPALSPPKLHLPVALRALAAWRNLIVPHTHAYTHVCHIYIHTHTHAHTHTHTHYLRIQS